jgi:hypothetical protein
MYDSRDWYGLNQWQHFQSTQKNKIWRQHASNSNMPIMSFRETPQRDSFAAVIENTLTVRAALVLEVRVARKPPSDPVAARRRFSPL